jgi:hypothetical protein
VVTHIIARESAWFPTLENLKCDSLAGFQSFAFPIFNLCRYAEEEKEEEEKERGEIEKGLEASESAQYENLGVGRAARRRRRHQSTDGAGAA